MPALARLFVLLFPLPESRLDPSRLLGWGLSADQDGLFLAPIEFGLRGNLPRLEVYNGGKKTGRDQDGVGATFS